MSLGSHINVGVGSNKTDVGLQLASIYKKGMRSIADRLYRSATAGLASEDLPAKQLEIARDQQLAAAVKEALAARKEHENKTGDYAYRFWSHVC